MFKRILVALDGSVQSQAALEPARHLAEVSGSELLLVRAVESRLSPSADSYSRELRSCEKYLKRLTQELTEAHIRAGWKVLDAHDDPATNLLWAIEREQPDMVVMTSHSRQGVRRLLHRSVAEKLLGLATCPVLVIGRNCRLLQSYIRQDPDQGGSG
ncbi:universal stress protein [bacterium]|nr:universal stress protein [bacterium]